MLQDYSTSKIARADFETTRLELEFCLQVASQSFVQGHHTVIVMAHSTGSEAFQIVYYLGDPFTMHLVVRSIEMLRLAFKRM